MLHVHSSMHRATLIFHRNWITLLYALLPLYQFIINVSKQLFHAETQPTWVVFWCRTGILVLVYAIVQQVFACPKIAHIYWCYFHFTSTHDKDTSSNYPGTDQPTIIQVTSQGTVCTSHHHLSSCCMRISFLGHSRISRPSTEGNDCPAPGGVCYHVAQLRDLCCNRGSEMFTWC